MSTATTYEARVRRDGRFWAIHVPAVNRWTQARKVVEIEPMARDLIAIMLDVDAASFEVDVKLDVPTSARQHLERAARLRKREAEAKAEAASERRAAARALKAEGLLLEDIGRVLGVSKQRASQLAKAA